METQEAQSTIVMKEIGDLKEKLATNTANTGSVLELMREMKSDLKVMGGMFVSHEEFKVIVENDKDKETRLRSIEKNVWKVLGALAILEFVFPVILHFLKW